jgi:DNA primase
MLALIAGQGGVAAAGDPASWAARLREAAPTEAQRDFLTRLAVEQLELYGELDEYVARGILGTVRTHSINRRESNLQSQLSRLGSTDQVEELQRVLAEIQALQQEKRALQEELAGGM